MLEREISMRSVKPDLVPFPQVGKPIGKKPTGNAVQTQVKRIVAARRRRDRIGTGDLAAIMLGEHGNELSRLEVKLVCFLDLPCKVLGRVRQIATLEQSRGKKFAFRSRHQLLVIIRAQLFDSIGWGNDAAEKPPIVWRLLKLPITGTTVSSPGDWCTRPDWAGYQVGRRLISLHRR